MNNRSGSTPILNPTPRHPLTEAHKALLRLIAESMVDDFLREHERDEEVDDESIA
jgi:hypothetical protein